MLLVYVLIMVHPLIQSSALPGYSSPFQNRTQLHLRTPPPSLAWRQDPRQMSPYVQTQGNVPKPGLVYRQLRDRLCSSKPTSNAKFIPCLNKTPSDGLKG